jgi:hypothetical protein
VALRFALPSYGMLIVAGGPKEWVQKLLCSGAASEKKKKLGYPIHDMVKNLEGKES